MRSWPIAEFVTEAAHCRVVIAKAEDAEEIRAGENDAPPNIRHPHKFANECLWFINVLKHIQCTDRGKLTVGKGQRFPIINATAIRELACLGDVRLGDIDSIRITSRLKQPMHDLANATADVKHATPFCLRLKRVGIPGVESGIPAGEEFGVGFVLPVIRILMTHPPQLFVFDDLL